MHFKMSSAICFNLDQSKILSSGNGLTLGLPAPFLVSVYLSSLPVAHLSDAPITKLVVTVNNARIQDGTTESSTWSLMCSVYSTVTGDHGLKPHPKEN